MKKVIELVRVSTRAQADDDRASVPSQRAINRHTAQVYGLTIIRSIELSDVSGTSVLIAPEIQELLRLIDSPDIHGVVAREFSRLMRPENFEDYALLQVFVDTNTLLYLPEGPTDFRSKHGKLTGTIQAVMAGIQRIEFLETTWNAKEQMRREGKHPQGKHSLPYAVDYNNGQWSYTDRIELVKEAFRRALAGNTNFSDLGRLLGTTDRGAAVILRNPIYTGIRVLDERRDPSPNAKLLKRDGRQGDRRRMKRLPDDVIRKRVIEQGAVSEEDFTAVQIMLETKRLRNWKMRPDRLARYTYNGFLNCSRCGAVIYSNTERDDYYVCKNRRQSKACSTHYMRRDKLEPMLDELLSDKLTNPNFINAIVEQIQRESKQQQKSTDTEKLKAQITRLQLKRERVLDAFFEGVIDGDERTKRLAQITQETNSVQSILQRQEPAVELSTDILLSAFSVLTGWNLLRRDEKRKILASVIPDIRIADYRIEGVFLGCCNERNHSAAASVIAARPYIEMPKQWAA